MAYAFGVRNTLSIFTLASVTLLGCATGATLDDGFGGAGLGGAAQGSTSSKAGSTSAKTTGVTSAETSADASSDAATNAASSNAATTNAASSNAATNAASSNAATNAASSSAMSSTGSGVVNCNPESPAAGCGANQHCTPTPTNMPFCEAAGAGANYALCSTPAQCAPVNECVSDGFDMCCMKYCTDDFDCLAGEICTGFQIPRYANGQEYGVCWDGYPCIIF